MRISDNLKDNRSENRHAPSVRMLRVGEQLRHILSEILTRGDVHDALLATQPISVTEVRMSVDLRHATVFIKPLLGKNEDIVLQALRVHTAFLQKSAAKKMRMKYTAKLKFLLDQSFDEARHIEDLLRNPRVARDLIDTSCEPYDSPAAAAAAAPAT